MDKFDPWVKKFTSGPWVAFQTVLGDSRSYWQIYNGPVLVATARPDQVGQVACDANVRLIVAAPDLLDVCEYALAEYERGNVVPHHMVDMAQAAVNKAYGYKPQLTIWSHEWQGG